MQMSQCAATLYDIPDTKVSSSHDDNQYMTIQDTKASWCSPLKKEEAVYENDTRNDNTKHPYM